MEGHLSRRVLLLLSTCCFSSMATMRVCDALLPSLASGFHVTLGHAAQAISAFAIAYGLMQLVFGPLGDRFGKVRVISLATLGCTVGNLGAAISSELGQLLLARVLSGAAAAAIVPLTMAWIGDKVPYADRQAVLARLLGSTVFGMIAGQWLGAVVADALSWRMAFALLAFVCVSAGLLLAREDRLNGTAATSATSNGIGRRAIGVLSIPWARTVLIVTFIEGAFAFGSLSFIPSYLHSTFNIPMSKAGAIVALYGVGGLIYSRFARRLVQHFGEPNLARLGGLCLALSYGSLALLGTWWLALPSCLMAGFGFYALHNTLQTHATQMAPAARGTAVSLFSCFLFFGQSLGILCASRLIDRYSLLPVFVTSAAGLLILALGFSALVARQHTPLVSA